MPWNWHQPLMSIFRNNAWLDQLCGWVSCKAQKHPLRQCDGSQDSGVKRGHLTDLVMLHVSESKTFFKCSDRYFPWFSFSPWKFREIFHFKPAPLSQTLLSKYPESRMTFHVYLTVLSALKLLMQTVVFPKQTKPSVLGPSRNTDLCSFGAERSSTPPPPPNFKERELRSCRSK